MRKRLQRAMPVLAAMVAASPAGAAENIDCALALGNDDQVSDQLFAAYRADAHVGEMLLTARGDQLRGCAAANQWSEAALTSSIRVLLGQMFSRGLLREMAALPLDGPAILEATDAYLATLAGDQRAAVADGTADAVIVEALLDRLAAAQLLPSRDLTDRDGQLIGELLSARANVISYQIAFVDQ